ncbi:MAG: hypothetical protein ABIZ56_03155 [Chthoniobacteraceae bacterium]
MNEPKMDSSESEFLSITRALRFALVAVVAGVSYPNIRCAIGILQFQQIYIDMIGGRALPQTTAFVLHARPVFIALSLALPAVAVLSLFLRHLSASIYLVGCILMVVIVQLFFTWHAVMFPLFQIITGGMPGPLMQGGQ